MKLSLTIMSAMIIFVIIGITSCQKSEFGLDESETQNVESTEMHEIQENVTTEMIISDLEKRESLISITENYIHEESGIEGTLYTYNTPEGIKQIMKAYKEPENMEEKGFWPQRHSVTANIWGTNPNLIEYYCNGPLGGCFGWANFFIIW